MAHLINQSGNIDDIRNTLRLMPIAGNRKELFSQMKEVRNSITNETDNYNRQTVITMLERHYRKLMKAYRSVKN